MDVTNHVVAKMSVGWSVLVRGFAHSILYICTHHQNDLSKIPLTSDRDVVLDCRHKKEASSRALWVWLCYAVLRMLSIATLLLHSTPQPDMQLFTHCPTLILTVRFTSPCFHHHSHFCHDHLLNSATTSSSARHDAAIVLHTFSPRIPQSDFTRHR